MNLSVCQWIRFPYEVCPGDAVAPRYLYAVGGYYSPDTGCPPWGSGDPYNIRFIGDVAGAIVVRYEDGEKDVFSLAFGYTMWFGSIWREKPAPFFKNGGDTAMGDCLRGALCVQGAFEGNAPGAIRLELSGKKVVSVTICSDPNRGGAPVFSGGYFTDGSWALLTGGDREIDAADPFWETHGICRSDPFPKTKKEALQRICRALHTLEEDYPRAPRFDFPESGVGETRIRFSGGPLAEIANGSIYHNMKNLVERTDEDGLIHTSYRDAPSWRYDGFGPYVERANSYYDAFYSRDGARAILTLNAFGHTEKARQACRYANDWMMYYPRQGLKLAGEAIPGHFSVMVNQPLVYSTFLAPEAHWPTRYTRERFGEEYQNMGNPETDGHGLMMMANYCLWRNLGRSREWAGENWEYLKEAAEWIVWSFRHPSLSFAKDDLLYGETEAAMNRYTLYANVPCLLGMEGYAEIARSLGREAEAEEWIGCARRLKSGIDRAFASGEGWDETQFGFYHDPVVTMLSDVYGYDTEKMPRDWVARSKATYEKDRAADARQGYYGATGIGYDHSMISQNALLLDQMKDAGAFMRSMCKLSYAPRLPEPYLVPEAICVDAKRGVIRRQGDLGNLVQLAEAMKCWLIVQGISPVQDGSLTIMPRLPESWDLETRDFPVQNGTARVSMRVKYPENGRQSAEVTVKGEAPGRLRLRFGPFESERETAEVTLNGIVQTVKLSVSGDSKWAWMETKI